MTSAQTRILLAEDDDDVRYALKQWLTMEGFDVAEVADGGALLDRIAWSMTYDPPTPPPDLVITDIRMPGINALNIIEGLRLEGWSVPVVVVSAYGDEDVRARVHGIETARFVAKPFDLDQLSAVIRDLAR